jgi:TonB family protein
MKRIIFLNTRNIVFTLAILLVGCVSRKPILLNNTCFVQTPDYCTGMASIDSIYYLKSQRSISSRYLVNGTDSLAKLIEYPTLAFRAGLEGFVQIATILDDSGRVSLNRILSSDAEIFNSTCIEGTRKARFTKQFAPIDTSEVVVFAVSFHIKEIK